MSHTFRHWQINERIYNREHKEISISFLNAAVRIKRWWTLSAAPLWRFATLATSTNDVAYFLTFMKVQPGANRRTTVPEKQLDALKKIRKIEKVAITMLCNLKAARRRASRFGLFWPNMYCACAEAATSEFPVEIPTLSLDSATLISRVSKSKRVKVTGVTNRGQISHFWSLKKFRGGGQNVWVNVAGSAQEQTTDILLARRLSVVWETRMKVSNTQR